jgi:hypothetical protein
MEKRRRERINRSLEELKNLILDNATTNVREIKDFLRLNFFIILECS